jgi:DNA-binding transcriptional ArsR family regulator
MKRAITSLVYCAIFVVHYASPVENSASTPTGPRTKPADAHMLKAIAHPVRLRLYEALVANGPSTNARLALQIPGAPGSLSYHLRQLARHGFVEEAPELSADARERWWRAVPGGLHWSEESLEDNPGAQSVASAAQSILLARQIDRMRAWARGGQQEWSLAWRSASVNNDSVLRLDASELRELADDVEALFAKWLARSRANSADSGHASQGNGRASVFLTVHAFPFEPSLTRDSRASHHQQRPEP